MESFTNKMQMLPFYRKKNNDSSLNVELSTNKLTPGILKIFGDHVSPGSNYKAVRVSTISTAEEVVREALEKFNLERCNPKDYVLCDVIGQFLTPSTPVSETPPAPIGGEGSGKTKRKHLSRSRSKSKSTTDSEDEKPEWVTEYVRAINEIEKPLVLQSLWKPTNGKSRRFELRNRIELENSFFFINNASSGEAASPMSHVVNGSINSLDAQCDSAESPNMSDTSAPSHNLGRYSRRTEESGSNVAPMYDPFLLMLKGCNNKDKLIHRLHDPTIIVGPYVEGEKKQCDVLLYSSDILLPHCWLYKKLNFEQDQNETDFDNLKYLAFVEPANGADVTINGAFITTTTVLKPGEIITFGHDYVFLYKDQSTVKDSQIKLPWLEYIKNESNTRDDDDEPEYATISRRKDTRDKCIQVQLDVMSSVSSSRHNDGEGGGDDTDMSVSSDYDEDRKRRNNEEEYKQRITKSLLQLSYNVEDEDELLHAIIEICDGEEMGPFKLIPSYFFIMVIEHSAVNFTDIETRKLLLKISSGLQGIAWEKTKEIGKKGSAVNEGDTLALHNQLLPELKPVLFWLTNALQMLHYLQCNLKRYLLGREDVQSTQSSVITADEELLSVLEEVIMFTFQQLVYHLTKILYGALPAVLEVNPFQTSDGGDEDDDEDAKCVHPSILQLTTVFTDVLIASQEHQIHPQIITQIFAYLFFFCNALLFNSLLEKGPTTKIFRWAKGVQIRGNLDVIEEWAQVNGLGNEFDEYFGKFVSVIRLLSIPKVQLLQYNWNQLRSDYALLNPAQLQLLLGEYQLNGKQKPRGWYPSPDEVEAALQSSDVLESFASHPPLMLPSSDFILDLNVYPESEEFLKHLRTLSEKFDKHDDEEVLQPRVRHHSMTIPKLTIQPIPHSDTSLTVNSQNETTSDVSSNVIMPDSTNDEMDEAAGHTAIKTQDAITKSGSHVLITNVTIENDSPIPLGTEASAVNKPTIPPRSSIDLDPNFADDLKDIEEKKSKSNVGSTTDISIDTATTTTATTIYQAVNINNDDVYFIELTRENNVLGLGLIDGQFTPMKDNGIYIRTIVPNTPAATEPRLRIGDRILSVNNEDVFDKDYTHAMGLIKTSGDKIRLLVSVSSDEVVNQIMAIA